MFVGREKHLQALNRSFGMGDFQFPVIYGRRRVGKTTLIKEFIKDKKSIYFVAVQSTAKENLEILSEQILTVLAPEAPRNPFRSFREAIEYVFERSLTEQFVFTIDEYPYLAGSDNSVSSILQAAIDKYHSESTLFLILCGSSMSFMERQVLGYESPLYGRRTSQFKILPFDYYEGAKMLHGFNNAEKIILYSLTSGIPEYLFRVKNNLPVEDNIQSLFFDPQGRMFEEPANLLKQELKMPETYNSIITAMASGSSKLNEIATRVGIETSQCSKMLAALISLGLVRKEHPITDPQSKKSIYSLADWMFVFWYRFVYPELSRITVGLGETICNEVISKRLSSHVGRAFEECAKQFMWRSQVDGKFSLKFNSIGRWWGNNAKERREEEIDFIALDDESAIFGECKWTGSPVGEATLDELIRKSKLFPQYTQKRYALFSKSGFTDSLKKNTETNCDVLLISVDDMF